MSADRKAELFYANGAVNLPHLGITLRRIFGCAGENMDLGKDGRTFDILVKGVFIGTLQMKHLKGQDEHKAVRKDPRGE